MTKLRKKGFTLIELIAVLVIMAILALIVTPLVMNIIRKARVAADKRSIDAYGRSIELAIASYLLDNGRFPTTVGELTIEYSGNEVVCETTQLNSDSSVYLTGCTVNGRETDYEYGIDNSPSYTAYSIGDTVTYNDVDYYVIKDSGTKESSVTLLKAEPLSYSEVQIYSAGTGKSIQDKNGYGGIYYTTGSNAYDGSYVKTTVDAWKTAKAPAVLDARLITYEELTDNLGFEYQQIGTDEGYAKTDNTPSFIYNSDYAYWTMSPYEDSTFYVWIVYNGKLGNQSNIENAAYVVVRPVIVLPKSAL